MKKVGVFVLLIALLFLITFVSAANETEGIEGGFACLEEKVGDCSELTNPELAFTILSGAEGIYSDCVDVLEERSSDGNLGNIRDTALGILALKHAGKNTDELEEWVLEKSRTPNGLTWYLQQDSQGETTCNIDYNSNSYEVLIGEDKKIQSDAGECLKKANSNFWFEINPSCYDTEFRISCDENFITSLAYKNVNSPTIYVLEGTVDSPALGSSSVKVNSKCFGESSCDYEASLWATLALLRTNHDVEEYIPYVIALSDTNKEYLPNAFVYSITEYEDYATQLFEEFSGSFWQAESSKYNKFYDTAIALNAVGGSSSELVTKAKDYLIFSQGNDGCWQNSIRDTAVVLWALEGKSGPSTSGTTTCQEGGFTCTLKNECEDSNELPNYYCSSLSQVCCSVAPEVKSCTQLEGDLCSSTEECVGNEATSSEGACCLGTCREKEVSTTNACELEGGDCYSSCNSNEEQKDFSCGEAGGVCCFLKEDNGNNVDGGGLGWIVWVLIIGIILLVIILAYVYRDKLKLFWFGLKSRFKKEDKGSSSGSRPGGFPPRGPPPGYVPRQGVSPRRPVPMNRPPIRRPSGSRDREMSDTFRRLSEMSK